MGYYFRYPRKQKSKEKIKREQLIAADKKIISFTKLENLGTKELHNQKKYYESELDEIKNNMSVKNYENQINEFKKIENRINKEIKKLEETCKEVSSSFYTETEYYIFKGFFQILGKLKIKKICCKNESVFTLILSDELSIDRVIESSGIDKLNLYFSNILEKAEHQSLLFDLKTDFKSDNMYEKYYPGKNFRDVFFKDEEHFRCITFEELRKKSINVPTDSFSKDYLFSDFKKCSPEDFKNNNHVAFYTVDETNYISHLSKNPLIQKFLKIREDDKYKVRQILDIKILESHLKKAEDICVRYLRKIELLLRSKVKQKEKIENVGYVYVLSNEAYPGVYKIGSTYGLVEERAEELTGTGHLHPFVPEFSIKIESAEYFEKTTHSLFNEYRVKQGREFFKMELKVIKTALKQIKTITNDGKIKFKTGELKKKIGL
jgi:hypothetical protein